MTGKCTSLGEEGASANGYFFTVARALLVVANFHEKAHFVEADVVALGCAHKLL
jgi:hypothetical protein